MLIHLVMSLQCDVTAKKARAILRHNWGNIVSWECIAIVPFCRPSERWLLEYSVQFLDTSKPESLRSMEGIQQEWLKKLKKAHGEHSCSLAWSYPINAFTWCEGITCSCSVNYSWGMFPCHGLHSHCYRYWLSLWMDFFFFWHWLLFSCPNDAP